MIHVVLGVPGAGKSYRARKWAIRSVQRGYSVLWLSPLNSEKKRLYNYFVKELDPDQVRILPTKPEKCPIMRRALGSGIYPLLSLSLCQVCKLRDSCPYYAELRAILSEIRDRKPAIYIGGFNYVWLAVLVPRMVIDEFDALYPQLYKTIPAETVRAVLELLARIDPSAAKALEARIAKSPYGDGYLLRPPSIMELFLDKGVLYLLSATYSPDPYKPDPRLILGVDEYSVEPVPHPPRRDEFIVYDRVLYSKSYTNYWLYREIAETVKTYRDLVFTIIARSKAEAARIHRVLARKDVDALTEGVNWGKENQWEWRRRRVRVLVIGGLFHRSLDIESDVVYAFYQHPPPSYPETFRAEYPDAASIDPDAHVIPVMRVHVQTLFRATRTWEKKHVVHLLDKTWLAPLTYYEHIWDFVRPRLSEPDQAAQLPGKTFTA